MQFDELFSSNKRRREDANKWGSVLHSATNACTSETGASVGNERALDDAECTKQRGRIAAAGAAGTGRAFECTKLNDGRQARGRPPMPPPMPQTPGCRAKQASERSQLANRRQVTKASKTCCRREFKNSRSFLSFSPFKAAALHLPLLPNNSRA